VSGAQAAYQQAITSGHPDRAPKAAFNVGLLLEGQGDVAGARAAYRQTIATGHRDWAPLAARNLANLLTEQGDVAGARAALQQAIDSGHPEHAPAAAFFLGNLLFTKARQTSPSSLRGWGNLLGDLLFKQGDIAEARAAYQKAIDSGHRDWAPAAALNLGHLLLGGGDWRRARAAYQKAADSGHPKYSDDAHDGLFEAEEVRRAQPFYLR
jgi:tetratricopeptide (TPR) repeat protein